MTRVVECQRRWGLYQRSLTGAVLIELPLRRAYETDRDFVRLDEPSIGVVLLYVLHSVVLRRKGQCASLVGIRAEREPAQAWLLLAGALHLEPALGCKVSVRKTYILTRPSDLTRGAGGQRRPRESATANTHSQHKPKYHPACRHGSLQDRSNQRSAECHLGGAERPEWGVRDCGGSPGEPECRVASEPCGDRV